MVLFLLCLLWPAMLLVEGAELEVLYEFDTVDFAYPSETERLQAIANGSFIPGNGKLLSLDVWNWKGRDLGAEKLFVTIPYFSEGIPAVLATVAQSTDGDISSPMLNPYPDWSWHQGSCDSISDVYRTAIDECDRLWVLDTGRYNKTSGVWICTPQLLIFDLNTDKLIRRHRFPSSMLESNSKLITVVVDTRGPRCADTHAYIADVDGFKLVVYNYNTDNSWRVSHQLFKENAQYNTFTIDGTSFQIDDGLFGMALGSDKKLYFHSLNSLKQCWVDTRVIRGSSRFATNISAAAKSFHEFQTERSSQALMEAMTDNGVLLYTLGSDNAIGCWNTKKPFTSDNLDIIVKDDKNLQFQSGMKVYGDHVWTLSSQYQRMVAGRPVVARINYGRVQQLLSGTKCEVPTSRPLLTRLMDWLRGVF